MYSAKVVNESEALRRWITRQWKNWTEKGVLSDVYEMSVVKVDYETRRYYRLLKNRGARLLNMGMKKSQIHSYPAHIL